MKLQTPRLVLEPLRLEDAACLFAYRSLPEVTQYQSFEPTRLDDAVAFIERLPPQFGVPDTWSQLAIRTHNGTLAGDLMVHWVGEHQGEVGITLAPSQQGQGLATEALGAVVDHLFELGKHRVFASVDPRNTTSVRLLERLGMRREAHFRESLWFKGAWVDDVIYARLHSDR